MDKKTIIVVAILFVFMFTWSWIDRTVIRPLFPETAAPAPTEQAAVPAETELSQAPAEPAASQAKATVPAAQPEPVTAQPEPAAEPLAQSVPAKPKPATPDVPEETWLLSNDMIDLTISSYGACIKKVVLKDYKQLNRPESPLIDLDFTDQPALRYANLHGFDGTSVFTLVEQGERQIVLQRSDDAGVTLTRTIAFEKQYELKITDQFSNQSKTAASYPLNAIQLGPMQRLPGKSMRGLSTLGIDILAPGAINTERFSKDLETAFKDSRNENGIVPHEVEVDKQFPLDWAAVKNKYFVQILLPENGGTALTLSATRTLSDEELANNTLSAKKFAELASVSATVQLPDLIIEPGGEQVRIMSCYIGPKKYELLSALGFHQEAVMEFATTWPVFSSLNFIMVPIKAGILWLLNFIHDYLWPHSYGLAIILITILMRIVFWPITQKSTESMKRMQALQPLIKEIREKYKDNQQKMQQATMALYKEHKVNPVSGCLPMLIQIPVFFALFAVLRAAIELRFAPFLWVTDLSQPENLLAGTLPIPLNILPLIMVATQFLQQKLTPTSADPQQAKMMQFMPLMFLFIFYTMPSGLVLYWTTNQCLMIIQQLMSRRKNL
jgi:YidC/Oxa1 family membrane protein insertase